MKWHNASLRWRDYRLLMLILAIGLVHGSIYTFLVPPWQHYDEPTHFEHAWLIAHRGRFPKPDEYDSAMRREITASMVAHDFFDNLPAPNLLLDKTWIGISQIGDRPLYYLILSLPLMVMNGAEIETQLYVMRLLSVLMLLGTLWIAYHMTKELYPDAPILHGLVPLSMVLTPSFIDLMSAVNNDVGATLIFSLFIWLGLRLITHGINITRIIGLILVAIACFFTKNTVFIALLLVVPIFSLALLRGRNPVSILSLLVFISYFVSISFMLFSLEDAAYWYRNVSNPQPTIGTRTRQPETIQGEFVFAIHYSPEEKRGPSLYQPLDSQTIAHLNGQKYTLGAWLWASEPVEVNMFALWVDGNQSTQVIQLTTTPQFYSYSNKVSIGAERLQLTFDPIRNTPSNKITIFADGIILAKGEYPQTEMPLLLNNGELGTWGGKEFTNLVRNPSAEKNWVTIKPIGLFILREQTSVPYYALSTLQDGQFSSGFYRSAIKNLFQSFWGRFGWNHIAVPNIWYIILLIGTVIGIIGNLGAGVKYLMGNSMKPSMAIQKGVWLTICMGLIWLAAIVRQTLPIWNFTVFTPSARYAYPAILPTMLVMVLGWYFISSIHPKLRWTTFIPILFLVGLSLHSIVTIFLSYYPV